MGGTQQGLFSHPPGGSDAAEAQEPLRWSVGPLRNVLVESPLPPYPGSSWCPQDRRA